MMSRYTMRDLIHLSPQQLYRELPKEKEITVEFDDGELITHTNITILSTYMCFPLTKFPDVPILKEYHLGNNVPTGGLINKRLNSVLWGIHKHSGEQVDPEYLSKLAIVSVNKLFNDITTYGAPSFSSMSMFDLYEIMELPELQEALSGVEPTEFSINKKVYPVVQKILKTRQSCRITLS